MLNFAPVQGEDCFATYHLRVNVRADLSDSLQRKGDQTTSLHRRSLDSRKQNEKARKEHGELDTEKHS